MPYVRAAAGTDPYKVVHFLQDTFKEFLRDLYVTKELNDPMTGHAAGDSAGNYGERPALAIGSASIDKIDIGFINQG